MEIITSKSNPKFMLAQKLKQKKFREEFKQILLEGEKLILDALANNLQLETLFVSEEKLAFASKLKCKEIVVLTPNLCKNLSTMVTSQNVFAIVKMPQKNSFSNNVLVLDKIQNPDNLGAIIRSAVATNFTTIYAVDSVDLYNEKTLRSSMGNVFKVNLIKTNYSALKTILSGYEILVAHMHGENIFALPKLTKKVALIIGNEGNGVSAEMMDLATQKVSIPMQNNVESLNASVSAGIIMYQIINKQGE